ncbi:hypothetical protein OEZ85_008827 [Tetradesmus obliquus]|uniref:Uncharacterized protein n=1 Tax=Tetradesmus obliquus TaxID=3088 RepID=A0ABY8TLX3_TETOB|nr:hypothetical protein OEZ85_008827 [Tetradesmus obliquus]
MSAFGSLNLVTYYGCGEHARLNVTRFDERSKRRGGESGFSCQGMAESQQHEGQQPLQGGGLLRGSVCTGQAILLQKTRVPRAFEGCCSAVQRSWCTDVEVLPAVLQDGATAVL